MKSLRLFAICGALISLISCNNRPTTESTELAAPVSVETIKLQAIQQYINTTGTVKATFETVLNSEVTGKYVLLKNPATGQLFKLGDRVKQGQTIVRFEDEEYVNGIAIESKKLNLDISSQEYEKQKSLYEKGGVTLREMRNAEVSKTNAQYDYQSAQLRLAKMNVVAPFSGVIVDLPYFTQGTRVTSGQKIVGLMNYDRMYLEINLPEKNLSDITVGQKVMVTSYTLVNDTLFGAVSELSPAISTETRTFTGKLTIDNPQLKLRPGMFVKADIITASKDSAIVIPKNIIMTGNRGKYVFVVQRNNTADDRILKTGIENQDNIEVVEGLAKGDRIIVKGFETLRDNAKVKVIP